MTVKISQYLRATLFAILVTSVLVSDVKARSYHASHVSHTHSSSHHSHSSPQIHSYPASPSHFGSSGGSVTQHHSSSGSSRLSGNSGSSVAVQHNYPQTYSNPTSHVSGTGFSHGYPAARPTSLSGSGSGSSVHSYPSTNTVNSQHISSSGSSRLSGNSGSSVAIQHNYPQTQSNPTSHISGTGQSSHGYPAARPSSLSGGGSGSSVHTYPSTNTLSGSGARPQYINGGTGNYQQNHLNTNTHHTTSWGSNQPTHYVHTGSNTVHHHHHYVYKPPTVIHYSSSYGANPVSYPIYGGVLPQYVYEYRGSGNKYSNLLAGLALYNLGRISATPRADTYHKLYIPRPDEHCRFGVRYRTGAVEEMNIDCRAITYFIFEAESQMHPQTQNFMNTNIVNQAAQTMLPDGTLVVPGNTQTQANTVNGVMIPTLQQILAGNGAGVNNIQQYNGMTTTTTQVYSITDSKLLGRPVHVNADMECYVTRITSFSNMQKSVPCGLLQEYTQSSLRSSAGIAKSSLTVIVIAIAFALLL